MRNKIVAEDKEKRSKEGQKWVSGNEGHKHEIE